MLQFLVQTPGRRQFEPYLSVFSVAVIKLPELKRVVFTLAHSSKSSSPWQEGQGGRGLRQLLMFCP